MSSRPTQLSLRRLAIVICFAVGFSSVVFAQQYGFDTWTTADGLPQNTVTGVAQTPDGYLWLSTFDGLARFDGVRFTIFDKGNTKGIANNRFSRLLVDKAGTIWAATENGAVTVYREGVFATYQSPQTSSSSVSIVHDADGNALIETLGGNYYLKDGEFVPAADPYEPNVKRIYAPRSGAKWIFRTGSGERVIDGKTTQYAINLAPEYLNSNAGFRNLVDARGAMWLAIKDKIYRLADGAVSVFTASDVPALNDLTPYVIFDDAEGNVWFVFGNPDTTRGLDWQLVKFGSGQFTAFDLGKSVNATQGMADREGNFWVATTAGLRRLRPQLVSTLSTRDGLVSNEVYPLLETSNGDVLIGLPQGVNVFRNGKIIDLGLKYSNKFPLNMRGLWEDPERRVWLGYQGEGGFGRIGNGDSYKRIGIRDLPNGATDFASDSSGNVWIATEEGLLEFRDDKEIAHLTTKEGLHNDRIITLHFDHQQNLWLGTYDGLSLFKDGKFTNFGDDENSPKGFVRAIHEDADGVLWFGTYGDGLVRYKDGRFFNYRVEHGLFNNGVFAILDDGRGNFWMSSNRGIHRVAIQELNDFADGKIPNLNSVSYDEKDGMLNAECNGGRIPAAIKTRDGKLWFATMGGVAIVDPRAERVNPAPPPVVIEDIAVDRKAASPNSRSEFEIEPDQTSLEIRFTGLSLTKSAQTKFRYRLEGFEDKWVEAGTTRTANYSYLPAGSYAFRVIAANASGVWNTEGATVTIVVHPYFYQTLWFRVLLALAIALSVWLIYQNRVSHLRKVAEAKTAFSRQLIENQEAERKRIAAELHDGLGQNLVIIKNRAMLGIKKGGDRERAEREFDQIAESATQALEEVREITNNLRPQLLDRLGLTKAINSMLKSVEDVVEVESAIDSVDGVFSENEEICVYRIVQESLNNVLKHAHATRVSVIIERAGTLVSIRIKDNGRGFDPAAAKNGLGLVGLKERTLLLNGELKIDSAIGEGTGIDVRIPTGMD
ncbi:MAG: hypothetical protein IPJ30_20700 [Acidobacteria bacterium]|nr:hypothetical protein [Acidobacteriota bacterium]